MTAKVQTPLKVIIVYLIAFPVMYFLVEAGWGLAGGIVSSISIVSKVKDPEFVQKIETFARERGIDTKGNPKDGRAMFNSLSEKDKIEFTKILTENNALPNIGFGFTFIICTIIFGIMGFFVGLITKTWYAVGLLPLGSFQFNNPIIRFDVISNMSSMQKMIVIVIAQFGAIYLLAFLGATIANKKSLKKSVSPELNT